MHVLSGLARAATAFALLAIVAGCGDSWRAPAPAQDGHADLREADLNTRVLSMRGTWRAMDGPDNPIVASYDYNDSGWRSVDITQPFVAQGFPREGAVWYRLHLRLPPLAPDAPPLSGFVLSADNAHAVYAATPTTPPRLLATSGGPSAHAERAVLSRRPAYFELPRDTALVLTWHIASHDYLSAGPFSPPLIAQRPVLLRRLMRRFGMAFGLGGLYFLLTGLCVMLWAFQRNDVRWLALAHVTVWMGLRAFSIVGIPDLLFPQLVDFRIRIILEAAPIFGLIMATPFLLWSLFPMTFASGITARFGLKPPSAILRLEQQLSGADISVPPKPWISTTNAWVLIASLVIGATLLAASFVLRPALLAYLLRFGQSVLVLLLIWGVAVSSFALSKRYAMALGLLVGMMILAVAGLHDVLHAIGVISSGYIGRYAFFAFVCILLFSIARRNAQYSHYAQRTASDLEVEVQIRMREFRAATIAAQAANLTKSRFLVAVSHDLRTPLATLLGYLDVLDAELRPQLSPIHREFFARTVESADRLRDRVNDMLDLTHLDAGDVRMNLRPLNAAVLARRAVEVARERAESKGLTLTTDLALTDTAIPLYVMADASRLHQTLRHVLDNAVKFTDEGSVSLRVSTPTPQGAALAARDEAVATAPPLPAQTVRFDVIDTGVGIAPEFRPRLFEHFAQDAHDFAQSQRGTGIGLTLAARIVAHMGGRIAVVTARGTGTTVRIDLPQAPPPA